MSKLHRSMVIGTVPEEVLRCVQRDARGVVMISDSWTIEVVNYDRVAMAFPLDADDWIGCRLAMPHVDDVYADSLFVTLSVYSNHYLGTRRDGEFWVPDGTLFALNPDDQHWLSCMLNDMPAPWLGLQWIIKKRGATKRIAQIAELLRIENPRRYQA